LSSDILLTDTFVSSFFGATSLGRMTVCQASFCQLIGHFYQFSLVLRHSGKWHFVM
jgi:hypothetical protein